MKNNTRTLALALAVILSACCLASCGRNNMNNEQGTAKTPSEVVSDIADDMMPNVNDGKTVDENSDEYTADEKHNRGDTNDRSGRSYMPEDFFGGK